MPKILKSSIKAFKINEILVIPIRSMEIQSSVMNWLHEKHILILWSSGMSDKIKLNISFPEKYEDINIPPLIFIPFIEKCI